MAKELETYANTITTLDQYAFRQYAKAFEIFPRILAENAGIFWILNKNLLILFQVKMLIFFWLNYTPVFLITSSPVLMLT